MTKKDLLEKLLTIAQKMSNVCYNLSQDSSMNLNHRSSMKNLQEEWDKTILDYYGEMKIETINEHPEGEK